jgi:hypothetical protein
VVGSSSSSAPLLPTLLRSKGSMRRWWKVFRPQRFDSIQRLPPD